MTDDDLRKIAELYNEINNTAGVKKFLRDCASFGIFFRDAEVYIAEWPAISDKSTC